MLENGEGNNGESQSAMIGRNDSGCKGYDSGSEKSDKILRKETCSGGFFVCVPPRDLRPSRAKRRGEEYPYGDHDDEPEGNVGGIIA